MESYKGAWPEKLLEVLWAYRTTTQTPTGETSFSLAFGHEAMVPIEIAVGSLRRVEFQTNGNHERLREELEFLNKKHEQAMKTTHHPLFRQVGKKAQIQGGRFGVKKSFPKYQKDWCRGSWPGMGRTIKGSRRVAARKV